MTNQASHVFVVGQVWECREQQFRAIVLRLELPDGRGCIASVRYGAEEICQFSYREYRMLDGAIYVVYSNRTDRADLMRLIYSPVWEEGMPDEW